MTAASRYEIAEAADRYPLIALMDRDTDSRVRICPERGGIVIGARLHGRELLYLDRDTFDDPEANIRGGIPVLFPVCGQLRGGEYEWEGQTYRMRNHGFARNLSWETVNAGIDGSAWATLVLRSTPDTLSSYPFDFELRFTYRLKEGALTIEQEYRNLSDRPMPMVAGFHPYFAAEEKNLSFDSDAARCFDYHDGIFEAFDGTVNLNVRKESVALLDAARPEIAFPLTAKSKVRMSYSEEFRCIVLWTEKGKPFVCVEPWMALNEALNDKKGHLEVQPGATFHAFLQFTCENS